jgi:hypothetical protein
MFVEIIRSSARRMCFSYNQLPISKNVVVSPVHGKQTVILASVSNDVTLPIVMSSTTVTDLNAACIGVRGSLNTTKMYSISRFSWGLGTKTSSKK